MNTNITIEHLGNQIRYSWRDDLGLHQYHYEIVNMEIGEIKNFKRETLKEGFKYSWNDNSGLHQHYVEFQT
jgi:hypothetical protein